MAGRARDLAKLLAEALRCHEAHLVFAGTEVPALRTGAEAPVLRLDAPALRANGLPGVRNVRRARRLSRGGRGRASAHGPRVYELPPTADELEHWLDAVERLVAYDPMA
jgi:hypothetical protein